MSNTTTSTGATAAPAQKHSSIQSLMNSPAVMAKISKCLGTEKKAAAFASSVISIATGSPQLRDCNPTTILGAAMVAATLDLPIVPTLGMAYIVPYKGQCQFQIGYKGLIELAERSGGYVPEETVALARRLAAADRIVIAAPFWDMSFPAILKVFIENMSLYNITFKDSGTHFEGLCRSEKVLYITTRGMDVHTGDPLEAATPYLKALSALWGWGEVITVAAENLDYSTPEEIDAKIAAAVKEGLGICRNF